MVVLGLGASLGVSLILSTIRLELVFQTVNATPERRLDRLYDRLLCCVPRRSYRAAALPVMSGNFVRLQPEQEILERLRLIDGHSRARDLVFQKIAKQLDSRTLDSAAFSFLLMEMLHRFEWALGEDAGQFLPKCILALTKDSDLAASAREAYEELGPTDEEVSPV